MGVGATGVGLKIPGATARRSGSFVSSKAMARVSGSLFTAGESRNVLEGSKESFRPPMPSRRPPSSSGSESYVPEVPSVGGGRKSAAAREAILKRFHFAKDAF